MEMFDVQLQGALALGRGRVAEMQTGEGKTLAGVPAVVWCAKEGQGVHVMTVNDYLARRDAQWMSGIYEFLGLSVGHVQQHMTMEERRIAYAEQSDRTPAQLAVMAARVTAAIRRRQTEMGLTRHTGE